MSSSQVPPPTSEDNKWIFQASAFQDTPSRQDGMDAASERQMRKSICRMIEEIGQAIHPRVTVIATNSAKVYFHRFFMVQSLTRQDPKMAGITCLFVACKAEECLRSIRQFIWALNAIETDPKTKKQLFPYGVGKKRDRPAEVEDETEAFQKVKQSMLHMERIVMHVLGFEFQVDHPTAYLTRLLRLFDEDGVRKETEHRHLIDPGAAGDAKGVHLRETVLGVNIMQVANAMANDCNSTTLCLQFGGSTLAACCMHLACKSQGYQVMKMSKWIPSFQERCAQDQDSRFSNAKVSRADVDEACTQLLDLYDESANTKAAEIAQTTGAAAAASTSSQPHAPAQQPAQQSAGAHAPHKAPSGSHHQQPARPHVTISHPSKPHQMQPGARPASALSDDKKQQLENGGVVTIPGSSARPYELQKMTHPGGEEIYSCSCSIWRHIADLESRRTCKHLRALRGERAELGRVGEEGILKSEAKFKEFQEISQRNALAARGPSQVGTPPVQPGGTGKRPAEAMSGRDQKRHMS